MEMGMVKTFPETPDKTLCQNSGVPRNVINATKVTVQT